MNITEIQSELSKLVAAMIEKGVVTPEAQLSIKCDGDFYLHLSCDYTNKAFSGHDYKIINGETIANILLKTREYISALPSQEETVTREYLTRIARAVDYATENSLPDEYVTPLRGVTMAMTENLLTKETAE